MPYSTVQVVSVSHDPRFVHHEATQSVFCFVIKFRSGRYNTCREAVSSLVSEGKVIGVVN